MKKILIPIIIILMFTGVFAYSMRNTIDNIIWSDKNGIKVGKPLSLRIESGMISDYSVIEKYELWDDSQRQKVVEYMKNNKLRIKEGYYEFNQSTTYEKALTIFQFEKIE